MESPDASNWAPQSPDLSTYHSADVDPIPQQHQGYRGSISHSNPYSPPTSSPYQIKSPFMPRSSLKKEESNDAEFLPDASAQDPAPKASRVRKLKSEGNGTASASEAVAGAGHIRISTTFPVARIKRIMQADDDVGKVAQVTPVVVSKALELFMISLVTKAASEAKARNQKRVSPIHLKQAVTKDEQFDFLSDIVSKVADAPAAAEKGEDAMDTEGKKRKGGGRKKRKADDDDF